MNVDRNILLWNRFNWRVAMVWYGSTVTLIYIIISGISRSLQTYIDELSGENTSHKSPIYSRIISFIRKVLLNGVLLHW